MIRNLESKLKRLKTTERNRLIRISKEEFLESKKSGDYHERRAIEYKKRAESATGLRVPYRPRLGIFKTDARLTFDPNTLDGRSYSWYLISKKIKGHLVLNTYAYSMVTSGHSNSLRGLFKQLGLKFVEIEAPQGLQCLDIAAKRHAELYAKAVVENKYARVKSPARVRFELARLKRVKSLGGKISAKEIKAAIAYAETERSERLARGVEARKLNKIQFVSAESVSLDTSGLRIQVEGWNYDRLLNPSNTRWYRNAKRSYREQALSLGVNKVIVSCAPETPAPSPDEDDSKEMDSDKESFSESKDSQEFAPMFRLIKGGAA
jgi:hypothetical protein